MNEESLDYSAQRNQIYPSQLVSAEKKEKESSQFPSVTWTENSEVSYRKLEFQKDLIRQIQIGEPS